MLSRIYLEITNICNRSCAFCPGTKRAPRALTPEEFAFLAAKLRPHTDYLYLHVMGEPLAHPQLPELLKIAGELGFRVILTTNGTLLAARQQALLSAPCLPRYISACTRSRQTIEAALHGIFTAARPSDARP